MWYPLLIGLTIGLIPSLYAGHITAPIAISLFLAFPFAGYCVGALPNVFPSNNEAACPYCKQPGTKLVRFSKNHIKTRGLDRIHAWGRRAILLVSLFWAEIGLFIGLAITVIL